MPKVQVLKSIDIKTPLHEVSAYVNSFKSWHKWSPWFVLEPTVTLIYGEGGKSYSWDGEVIGSGEIQLIDEVYETGHEESREFKYLLKTKKPYKSKSDVTLKLETIGLYTRVTWELQSSLPPFLFLLKNKVSSQIGMDYDRGLKMLKDLCENGKVHSSVQELGERTLTETQFLTLNGSCTIKDLSNSVEESFKIANQLYTNPKVWTDKEPVIIYDKFDTERELCVYRIGIPVKFKPDADDYPADFNFIKRAPYKVFMVSHEGAYRHLGNAWALGMTLAEQKKFSLDSEALMMEIYKNDPNEVESEAHYLTYVLLPIKE